VSKKTLVDSGRGLFMPKVTQAGGL